MDFRIEINHFFFIIMSITVLSESDIIETIDRRLAKKLHRVIGNFVEEPFIHLPLFEQNSCHDNCKKYMKKHPGKYLLASGWLVFSKHDTLVLIYHSMLWDKSNRKLICVTKYDETAAIPNSFISANEKNKNFENTNYIFEDIKDVDNYFKNHPFLNKLKIEKHKGYISYRLTF
jgi:hypothetical protein